MRILVTGNMGYVGPWVVRHLRQLPGLEQLTGLDTGYFAHCLVGPTTLPECAVDAQVFKDVRTIGEADVAGYDVVVYLAAISNDPMGKAFEEVTLDVNWKSAVRTAEMVKRAGAKAFVFASSCSIYGAVESGVADESSPVNPLTAYARSKIGAETDLKALASERFVVSCLRFATACGASERLRLDLVLNDFVAGAMASKHIAILSDGTPWRPLIHVEDMARAIAWAAMRPADRGGPYLVVNVGTNTFNYQVKELAEAVVRVVPGATVTINKDAPPDKRSYRVSFDRYTELAPDHVPRVTLDAAVQDLVACLTRAKFTDAEFRTSPLMRLNVLSDLQNRGLLTADLRWSASQ